MKKIFLTFVALALCLPVSPVFAAQAAEEETARLEPVVVTAGRIEEKARDVTKFVTVIPQEEIQKNQYQDMGGLLRNYGVQIDTFIPNQQTQVKMRGVFASRLSLGDQGVVMILVDGRRIGSNDLGMIPMVNVERVEILRGPAAVQYGTSAIGGVINVITRKGTEDLSASIQGGAGSWDNYRGQGSMAWAKGPVDFSGGVSYMTAGDYRIGGSGSNRKYHNTALDDKVAYSANIGFNFLDEHRIGITLLGVDTQHVGSPNTYATQNRRNYLDLSSYSGDLLYEGSYKDFGLSWKARYFLGEEKYYSGFDDRIPYDPMLGTGDATARHRNEYQGAQGQVTFQKSILTLTGGVDWMYSDTKKQSDYNIYDQKFSTDNIGVFALAKVALFDDRLIVNGGLRHDTYRLKTKTDASNSKNREKTVPSLGLAVHPLNWLTLKTNYGESYRVPNSLEVLGFGGGFWGPTIVPNPDLKPEEAKSWDVGFEINHKSLHFGLAYFETEYKKKIFSTGWPERFENTKGKIWYKGFEGSASYDIGEAFDWPVKVRPYVNFTALTERKASKRSQWGSNLGSKVPNVSDFELAYGLNFAHSGIGFEADLRFNYIGSLYTSAVWPNYERTGDKTTADLFLRQKIYASDKTGTLSAFGDIRNITDERVVMYYGYPHPGRSFFVGLRYDY